METLIAHLQTERPSAIELNLLQREVLGKMLMNLSFDLLRTDEDATAELAEALAERLFQEEQDESGEPT